MDLSDGCEHQRRAVAAVCAPARAAVGFEVRDSQGKWRMVYPSIGFPSGKDKTMIIDLAGKFPTKDHHVRLRTSMQIYWDQAFVARSLRNSETKVTTLAPQTANLHSRGFSRMYRKGGRYGPYWFAYEDVTKQSPWRPIEGDFTRFGDVLPLLDKGDDMYIIMAPGDETTLEFDASSATSLPRGWKRDFLLYTDGWIKDSDLNTAHGTTVGPLPFHAVKSYPLTPGDSYPTDPLHQRCHNPKSVQHADSDADPTRSSALIHADVIDEHLLRERRRRVGIAGPVAADREVQQHEERVIEDPRRTGWDVAERSPAILPLVHEPPDFPGTPLDREDVVVVREWRRGERVRAADSIPAGIARAMQRAVHRIWLLPDVLHDVDLATLRPTDGIDVIAEHPECGPDPLSSGDLDAGLVAAEQSVRRVPWCGVAPRYSDNCRTST